jgi:hypothetical protein
MTSAFSPRGALIVVALVFSTAFVATIESRQSSAAKDNPCDPKLIPTKGDPLAYGRRGERCEGLYVLEVAGSADLSLVAFTEAGRSRSSAADDPLQVRWGSSPEKLPVHVRAVSLRRPIYYRMDAVRVGDSGQYAWPFADVVARLNLKREELGLVGWVEQTIGDRPCQVYVPLRLGSSSEPASGHYVASIVPGVELSELFVTLAAIGADGRERSYVKRDEALSYGFYPAERPIAVKLSTLPDAGLYRLTLGGQLRRGGSSSTSFVFYHPGNPVAAGLPPPRG